MKSYDYAKQYLLERLRLVPSYFVDAFNRVVRQTNETFKSYIAGFVFFTVILC